MADSPLGIPYSFANTGGLYGMYLQDEWRILPAVTINGGLRFDGTAEYTHGTQLSPRLNLVWKPTQTTTIYGGYARYFVHPPFELVGSAAVTQYIGTTAQPSVLQVDVTQPERSNYFDVGINQVIIPGLTVGVDGYYKISNNLINEGQFGAPIILTAFNYAHGRQEGVQWTASYDHGPWSLYGNIAWSRALGTDITSAQFNFGPQELAFIGNKHGQPVGGAETAKQYGTSAGRPERWRQSLPDSEKELAWGWERHSMGCAGRFWRA